MRYSFGSIVRWWRWSCPVEMLYFLPALSFNVLGYGIQSLINWYTNDPYLVTPSFPIFFKHFLVVSHRLLARWAPCSPKINQEYLTWLVLNGYSFLSVYIHHIFNHLVIWTNTHSTLNGNCVTLRINSLEYFCSSSFKCFESISWLWRNISIDD